MALPLAPVAIAALKYGTVAATAYGLARSIHIGATSQSGEDALDDVSEGMSAHKPKDRPGQVNATFRMRRVVRLGQHGPGLEIDAASLLRIRIKKV